MNKKFTKLMAALALLTFLTVPLGMWGQTRTEVTTTFKAGSNYSAGMTLPYETGGLEWVTSAKPAGFESASPSRGIQYSKVSTDITTTIANATITKVEVVASTNGTANANSISVYVGNTQIGSTQNMPQENNKTYTFEDAGKTGEIKVTMTNAGGNTGKSTYIKSIAVTYTSGSTTYTVTYNANGGTGTLTDPNSPYQPNATITVLANTFTKTGHSFAYWTTDQEGNDGPYAAGDEYPITANTTFYAQWSLNQYNVAIEVVENVDLYADMLGEGEDDDIDYGTQITLSYDALASGYVFGSWVITKNEGSIDVTSQVLNGSTLTVPDYAITVSANLVQVYTVNFNLNGGTFVDNTDFPQSIVEKPAGEYTLPSATRSGYNFTGWSDGENTYSSGDTYTVSGDVDFDAQWEVSNDVVDELTGSMVYEAMSGTQGYQSWSGVTASSSAVYAGQSNPTTSYIQIRATSPSGIVSTTSGGYVRKVELTWAGNNSSGRTITVYGKNTAYESSIELYSESTRGTELGTIKYGTNTTIEISGNYAYVGLLANGGAAYFDPLKITWEVETQYTITCSHTGDDGTIAADHTTAAAGETITLTATPADHYHLVSWEVIGDEDVVETNPTGVNTATFEMPASNVIVDATFAQDTQYDITIPAEIENNVIVDVTNNKAYADETVTISVDAPEGQVLNTLTVTDANSTNVEISPAVSPSVSEYTFVMPASNVSIAATFKTPVQSALTVTLGEHIAAIFVFDDPNGESLIEDGAAGSVLVLEGTEILVSPVVASGCVLETLIVDGVDVTTQLDASGAYTFTMPSHAVTITATASEYVAPVVGKYVRITSLDDLKDGCKVIIAARYDEEVTDGYYAMPGTASGKPNGVAFTSETSGDDEILPTDITTSEDTYYWIVNKTNNTYTFTNAEGDKIGYGSSTNFGSNGNFDWSITREESSSDAMVADYEGFVITNVYTTSTSTTRAFALQNTTKVFGAYAKSNMTGTNAKDYNFCLDFFVYTDETHTKNIAGNKWYFIASPVGAAPTNVNDLTDLYYYDEQEHYWRNKKNTANAAGFNFAIGKGYLCANADPTLQNTPETIALTFTGTPVFGSTYNVPVTYNETTSGGDDNTLAGWNLVGNPFGSAATIAIPCYTLRGAMNMASVTAGTTISACEAVMVQASSEGQVTFTKATAGETPQPNQLQLTVAQQVVTRSGMNSQVNDNAIINFNAGSQLEKFAFNADAAKLYIPQNGKDFAIVSAEGQGEMPVNFRAAKNGTYTLTVNPEGVEMNYLHLIDNMTGTMRVASAWCLPPTTRTAFRQAQRPSPTSAMATSSSTTKAMPRCKWLT